VALYETATGRLPFAGATTTETMDRILHAQPEPIAALNAAIPSELERIAFKCLEKSAEERYQSARDLLTDLRHLQRTDGDRFRISPVEHRRHNVPAQLTSFAWTHYSSCSPAVTRHSLPSSRLTVRPLQSRAESCGVRVRHSRLWRIWPCARVTTTEPADLPRKR
jgi:serine/threonine protein kinase